MHDDLARALRERDLLLLLDNFDQVIEAGPSVADLLTECPGSKVLVTSREVLRIRGEREFAVSLLSLPDLSRLGRDSGAAAEALPNYASVALFLERTIY